MLFYITAKKANSLKVTLHPVPNSPSTSSNCVNLHLLYTQFCSSPRIAIWNSTNHVISPVNAKSYVLGKERGRKRSGVVEEGRCEEEERRGGRKGGEGSGGTPQMHHQSVHILYCCANSYISIKGL